MQKKTILPIEDPINIHENLIFKIKKKIDQNITLTSNLYLDEFLQLFYVFWDIF